MGKVHAWRLLGCLPILKRASLLRGTDYTLSWQQLFHDCLKMVFQEQCHPCMWFLPAKLALYLGGDSESSGNPELAERLKIPPPQDKRLDFTVPELNSILVNNIVTCQGPGNGVGHLRTIGCVRLESELCKGLPNIQCYPFNLDKHCFHGKNPKVLKQLCSCLMQLCHTVNSDVL